MKINEHIRVEPIYDHKHGRRFQVLVLNKEKDAIFTTHHDVMAREYVKIKLSEADIMQLIQELNRNFTSVQSDPKVLELQTRKSRLKLITDQGGE